MKNPATGDGLTFVSPFQEYGTPVITKSGNVLTFTLSGLDFSAPVGEPYSNVPYSEPYGHRKGFNIFVIPSSNAQIADANIILGQQNA